MCGLKVIVQHLTGGFKRWIWKCKRMDSDNGFLG